MTRASTILILTALPVERDAVLKYLSNIETERHPRTGTIYHRGNFVTNKTEVPLIVGLTDQTNVNAAAETERALDFYSPAYAFFVGVAGGIKDVRVGDIVIGSDVIGYERGKAEEKLFKPRPQFGSSSYALERAAESFSMSSKWKETVPQLVNSTFSENIQVLKGTIASGEKVDASYNSALHEHIKNNASHALAIEMEGLGFLAVCRSRPSINSLLLRGISDLVNDKGEMDSQGSQPYACQNVCAFLFGLIEELNLETDISQPKTQLNILFEIICKLYPRGLEDRKIWERAGGDLAVVNLNVSGKGQWYEAIRLLEQGGGGQTLSASALINEMLKDFANNVDLQTVSRMH